MEPPRPRRFHEGPASRAAAGSGASAQLHPPTRRGDHDQVRIVHRDSGVGGLRWERRGRRHVAGMNMLRLQRFVRSSLWLLPLGCLAAGALLVMGTLAVDRATGYRLI